MRTRLGLTALGVSLAALALAASAAEFERIGGKRPTPPDLWIEGKVGKAVEFDGLDAAVNCGHGPSLNITDALTVAFWVKGKAWTHTAGFVGKQGAFAIHKRQTESASGVYFWMVMRGVRRSGIWDPKNHMKLVLNEWQHVAFTYDSATATGRSYLNGRPHSSPNLREMYPGLKSYTLSASSGDLVLGASPAAFRGCLDEVHVYKRVLSDAEIASLCAGRPVPRQGLVGLWTFEEGKGGVTADLSGKGNTGRVVRWPDMPDLPTRGGPVDAPLLYRGANMDLWRQNATAKVMHGDKPIARKANAVITVSLARNEREPFQLVITPKKPLKGVRLAFSDLKGARGAIAKANITWRLVKYVPIDKPSDTSLGRLPTRDLPTIYTQKGEPGWYPDALPEVGSFDVTEERNYPLWITIRTPADIPAGLYTGKVSLAASGAAPVELSLRVRVWDFGLPEVFHTRNQAPFRKKFGTGSDPRKVARNLAEHHFSIEPIPARVRVTFKGSQATLDTTEFDKWAAYCLDELKMTNFFFPNLGLYFTPSSQGMLRWEWNGFKASDKLGVLRQEFLDALGDYIHKMSAHLRKKGWFDKFRVSLMDEPRTQADFAVIRQMSKAIKKVEPDIKIYETKWPIPELIGDVDVWCLTLLQPGPVKAALARGESIEWYPNWHPLIDRPNMNTRMIGWFMWKYRITGTLLFSTQCNWVSSNARMAWLRPRFVYANGRIMWGMGSFFYPDADWNPISSIRWELFRETFEDYEYLYLLDSLCRGLSAARLAAPQAALLREAKACLRRLPDAIVPYYEAHEDKAAWKRMAWETDPNKVHEARAELARHIELLSRLKR